MSIFEVLFLSIRLGRSCSCSLKQFNICFSYQLPQSQVEGNGKCLLGPHWRLSMRLCLPTCPHKVSCVGETFSRDFDKTREDLISRCTTHLWALRGCTLGSTVLLKKTWSQDALITDPPSCRCGGRIHPAQSTFHL